MSKRVLVRKELLKKHHRALKTLAHIGPKKAQIVIENSPAKFLHVIRILSKSVLDGTIPLETQHVKKLKRHKILIRGIANSNNKDIKKLLNQKGGSFFSSVLGTILPLIPMLL